MLWKNFACAALVAACALGGCRAEDPDIASDSANQTEDQADKIFSISEVEEFGLTIDPNDIAKLNAEVATIQASWDLQHLSAPRTSVPATFTYAGATYPAKVKIKGMASVQGFDKKPSLKIDFDDHVLGLSNLTLDSMTQDASMVHEALAYKMYDAVGVPVPRVGYSNLTINGQPYGLYVTLDAIDKHFLERKFGTGDGIIYESTYGGDVAESFIGTLNLVHQSAKTNPQEETDHAKLKELIAAVQKPGDDLFFGPSPMVDTDKFLSLMAMAYVIGDWDNYVTANNFRLHRHPQTGLWSIIPTGTDQTFMESMPPYRGYLTRGNGFPVLFEKCLASPRCIAAYDQALDKAIKAFQAPDGTLAGTLSRRIALVDPYVTKDPKKPYNATQTQQARDRGKALIQNRPAEIAAARTCVANGKEIYPGACAGRLVIDASSKTCLNVNGFSYDDGAALIAYQCGSNANGRFLVRPAGNGDYELVASHSGKCASVDGASTADGAAILQWTCGKQPNQLFTLKAVNGGVQLVAKHSGKCLDLGATDAVTHLKQAACGDPAATPSQVWTQRASLFD